MSDQLWSWILGIVGVVGFILAGKKIWWAWYINLGCQVLWFFYAWVTDQHGFIATAVVYSFVFFKNARDWTREHFRDDQVRVAKEFNKKMHYNESLETAEALIARGEPISPVDGTPRVMTHMQSQTSLGLDDKEELTPIPIDGPVFFSNEQLADSDTMQRVLDNLMEDIREDAFKLGCGYRAWFEETINGKYLHWEFV